ncbi:MAG: hypothetical protein ACE5IK_04415 [Acidobacteriota bacterium]
MLPSLIRSLSSRIAHSSGRRLGLAVLPLVALGVVSTPAQTAGPWHLRLAASASSRYDDNILSLSDRDQARLKDPVLRNSDRFRIESEDDVILIPRATLRLERSPRRGRETAFSVSARAFDYQRNSVKDFQEYVFTFRQELNVSRRHLSTVSAGFSHIPRFYLRQLVDDDASLAAGMTVRNSADYARNRAFFRYSQEILNRTLSVAGTYARERRNYNDNFNERDANSDVSGVRFTYFPLHRNRLRIRPYYEHERRGSRGDLGSTAVVDDDVAFSSDLFGVDVRWLWGHDAHHRRSVTLWFNNEDRDFGTSNVMDTGHFGRSDDIDQIGATYGFELGPVWKVDLGYRYRNNDLSLPGALGGTTITSFSKNVFTATLRYRFRFHRAAS